MSLVVLVSFVSSSDLDRKLRMFYKCSHMSAAADTTAVDAAPARSAEDWLAWQLDTLKEAEIGMGLAPQDRARGRGAGRGFRAGPARDAGD